MSTKARSRKQGEANPETKSRTAEGSTSSDAETKLTNLKLQTSKSDDSAPVIGTSGKSFK